MIKTIFKRKKTTTTEAKTENAEKPKALRLDSGTKIWIGGTAAVVTIAGVVGYWNQDNTSSSLDDGIDYTMIFSKTNRSIMFGSSMEEKSSTTSSTPLVETAPTTTTLVAPATTAAMEESPSINGAATTATPQVADAVLDSSSSSSSSSHSGGKVDEQVTTVVAVPTGRCGTVQLRSRL